MLVVKKVSVQDEEDLRYIIEHSEDATVFHTLEWNRLVSQEFGVRSRTLIAREGGRAVGMYTYFIRRDGPFKCIKSPFREADSIYGGPIVIKDLRNKEDVIKMLVMGVREKRVEYYQILAPPGYSIEWLKGLGYRCRELFTSVRGLEGSEEDLWMGIDSKRRNLVRKAQGSGVKVIDGVNFIDEYYQMLVQVFKGVGGRAFSKSYYRKVVGLIQRGWVKPLVALYQGKPIAGAIFLCFKDTVYYWSGASFREYGSLAPNDLIQWEIMRWARGAGYKYYDLVIVEPERLPGIAHFKLGFGGELVPIYEAMRRTALGELARGIRALSNPKKVINKIKKQIPKIRMTNTK